MTRFLKSVAWMVLLAAGLPSAHAFTLAGPFNEAWQVEDLGFNVPMRYDLVAPKNIAEEYRRNVPVMYYSFDSAFLEFYGSNGVAAVEAAFAVLNNLTNVSAYTPDLREFPTEARRQNYRAAALNLYDLKSFILGEMMEQLGLADPIRYNYCLHDRVAGANCPVGNLYMVTMRNFGIQPSAIDQLQYSPYVNGVLYSYYIHDYCGDPHPGEPLSEAINQPVDGTLLAYNEFLPVAASDTGRLGVGGFFTGLTRDDVAGLRYLLRWGNANWEDVPDSSVPFVTNNTPSGLSMLVTSNLVDLLTASRTNDDAGFAAAFPGISFNPGLPAFELQVTTNSIAYYTNYPWNPVTVPPTLIVTNSYTTNVTMVYQRTFNNVVTNWLTFTNGQRIPYNDIFTNGTPITNTWVTVIDDTVGTATSPWLPVGTYSLITNQTVTAVRTNSLMGEYFVIPTNACGFLLLSNILTTTTIYTNIISATNGTLAGTNTVVGGDTGGGTQQAGGSTTTTNSTYSSFTRTILTYYTNHYFAYFPVICPTNYAGLRRGVEKLTFLRRDYDSLLGQYFYPQTNWFQMTTVSNSVNITNLFRRTVTTPDFLFTASDLIPGPAADPIYFIATRNINFSSTNANGLAGPGIIGSPTVITLNKSGPMFENGVQTYTDGSPAFWYLDEASKITTINWGSFDDSTNAPVVYPNGASIEALENMMILRCTTTSYANAQVGHSLYLQLAGVGGAPYTTPPYTPTSSGPYYVWSMGANSPGLPPGLNLAYDGSGVIYGTPTTPGIYDFVIRMTDANNRFADWDITLTVNP